MKENMGHVRKEKKDINIIKHYGKQEIESCGRHEGRGVRPLAGPAARGARAPPGHGAALAGWRAPTDELQFETLKMTNCPNHSLTSVDFLSSSSTKTCRIFFSKSAKN